MEIVFFWIFDFIFFLSLTCLLVAAFTGTCFKGYTKGEACGWYGLSLLASAYALFVLSTVILNVF